MNLNSKTRAALTLLIAFSLAGCRPVGKSEPTKSEPSLAAQMAAVRAEKSDQIQMEQTPVDDDDLRDLASLTNLRVLLLDHPASRISADGLQYLRSLKDLQHLRLRGGQIDDQALGQIAKLEHLRILNVPQAIFSDAALESLKQLPDLEQLRFGNPHVTNAGMKTLAKLPSLKRLHLIDVPITGEGLRELAQIKQLESLYIDGGDVSDAALDELFRQRPDLHVHLNQQHHDRDPHQHPHP